MCPRQGCRPATPLTTSLYLGQQVDVNPPNPQSLLDITRGSEGTNTAVVTTSFSVDRQGRE